MQEPCHWSQFVWRLHDSGVVEYSLTKPTEEAGVFFVKKKSGDLRLVVDCRRSNWYCGVPHGVSLCSGSALSQIELGPDDTIFTAQCDIQTAFYHMELPSCLRLLFGLRGVRASDLATSSVSGVKVKPGTMIFPRLRVIPMGWSWSFFFCQKIHERAAESLGLPASQGLVDGQAASTLADGPMHTEYVGNFAAPALQPAQANVWMRSVQGRLTQLGLQRHEVEDATPETKLLGRTIVGARGLI